VGGADADAAGTTGGGVVVTCRVPVAAAVALLTATFDAHPTANGPEPQPAEGQTEGQAEEEMATLPDGFAEEPALAAIFGLLPARWGVAL